MVHTVNSALILTLQKTQTAFGDLFGKYDEAKVCIQVSVFVFKIIVIVTVLLCSNRHCIYVVRNTERN